MTRSEDVGIKRARMREFLQKNQLGGVLLTLQRSFSWYTGGGQNHVALTTESGVASVLATPAKDYVLSDNIESERVMSEEGLGDLGYEPIVRPWHADASVAVEQAEKILDGASYGTDTGPYASEIAHMQYSLTPFEVGRYRALGKDTAEAVAGVCKRLAQGQTEWQIAGATSDALCEREIIPAVVLVAADERIESYRHPVPTANRVERYAMVVVCARRGGLIVSTTRLVHFGAIPDELCRKHDAVAEIDATFIGGTVVGANVSDIFSDALAAYERTGYGSEWELHHQGGGTGYGLRDFKGTPDCDEVVQPWQAYAWNPSIAGTKAEDTIIATPNGPEVLSIGPEWPMIEASTGTGQALPRADILVR